MLQSIPKSSSGCCQCSSTAKPSRAISMSPLLPLPLLTPIQKFRLPFACPPAKSPGLSRNDLQTLGSGRKSGIPDTESLRTQLLPSAHHTNPGLPPQWQAQDLRKQIPHPKAIWQITLHYLLDLAAEGTENEQPASLSLFPICCLR